MEKIINSQAEILTQKLDLDDFHNRWRRARISAIHKIDEKYFHSGSLLKNESEEDYLTCFLSHLSRTEPEESEKIRSALLKCVFDNSRLLALSLSKSLGVTFELHDFQETLQSSEIPCAQGKWESRATAR